MTEFMKSYYCRSCVHCHTCRDRKGGRRWREDIAKHFDVPGIDWICTHGKPWGYKGGKKVVSDTKAKPCAGCQKGVTLHKEPNNGESKGNRMG